WAFTWARSALGSQAMAEGTSSVAAITVPPNASGLYCSDTSITLASNNSTFNVTLVAPHITVAVQHVTLTPYTQNLLFYSTDDDLLFTPNNSDITGWIWVENGKLTYGGDSGANRFFQGPGGPRHGEPLPLTPHTPPRPHPTT